jgi:simple sugar transport system permease protein
MQQVIEHEESDTGMSFLAIARRPEFVTFSLIVAICVAVAVANPAFLSAATLIDIARATVTTGLFALGVFVILAAGGIDVSFTAIAALTMYGLSLTLLTFAPWMPAPIILVISIVIGGAVGMFNGLLVYWLRVPALIVTIGTQYFFRGILLAFVGTVWLMDLPRPMVDMGKLPLLSFDTANGATIVLPVFVLVLPIAGFVTWWIFRYTLMGRAIFAMGGNPQVAERLGYDLQKVHLFVFGYAGALAGLAGILHASTNRLANPFDLVGMEITVIAAVVLGGARITGGTGTVVGTLLGVLLVTIVDNVLVLVGIPSTWQRVFVGAFILTAAAFFSRQSSQSS